MDGLFVGVHLYMKNKVEAENISTFFEKISLEKYLVIHLLILH
jgi:hypothetical protein